MVAAASGRTTRAPARVCLELKWHIKASKHPSAIVLQHGKRTHLTDVSKLNNDKMAGKEATVFIVDCGRSMGKHGEGRQQSNLDWSLQYVWDKITTTVATGRKTALVGVVGHICTLHILCHAVDTRGSSPLSCSQAWPIRC